MDIKEFVNKESWCHFDSFRAGIFYYNVFKDKGVIGYQFQVPLDDIGGATLKAQEKSVTMMRWIRKSIEDKTFIKL
jgi:hypothetical protein